MRTIQQLAQEAIDIQDPGNPLGLTKSFAEATQWLRDERGLDTAAICRHPVFRLWVSKVHSLASMGLSHDGRYSRAYGECRTLAQSPTPAA